MSSSGSDKSRLVALALAGVLGFFGAHRFYVGKIGTGLLMLFTFGGLGFWYMADFILVAAGSFRDVDGRRVMYWTEDEIEQAGVGSGRVPSQIPAEFVEEIDALRAEVSELAERVDFTERLLARSRQPD